jgi:hypothetical protein
VVFENLLFWLNQFLENQKIKLVSISLYGNFLKNFWVTKLPASVYIHHYVKLVMGGYRNYPTGSNFGTLAFKKKNWPRWWSRPKITSPPSRVFFIRISYRKKKHGLPSRNFEKKIILIEKGDEITRIDGIY